MTRKQDLLWEIVQMEADVMMLGVNIVQYYTIFTPNYYSSYSISQSGNSTITRKQ